VSLTPNIIHIGNFRINFPQGANHLNNFFIQNLTPGKESPLPDTKFHSYSLRNVTCPGGAIGSVAVRAAWLQRRDGSGFNTQAGRIICVML